jgi:serine protease
LGIFVISKAAGATNFKSVLGKPYKVTPGTTLPKSQAKASSLKYEIKSNYIKDEVIVKFKPEITVATPQAKSVITSLPGAKVKRIDKEARFTVIKLPKNVSAKGAVKFYENLPNVEYAELNHIIRASWSPNDPNYQYQWHFNAISLADAWDYDTTTPLHGGDPSIVVAVLDTGIAYESYDVYSKAPDFTGSYPAFTQGYDYINNDSHANDDQGHGTHVASTIAQSTNNNISVAGIAFNSTLMPVKVLGANGSGSDAAVASGITYAKTHGAHILNMSLGSTSYSQTIADAVADAIGAGKILIAAAGNGGQDSIGDPECDYPARYAGVICVASTRYNNNGRSSFSNYGTGFDISAPGGQVSEAFFGVVWDLLGNGVYLAGDGILQQSFTEFFAGTTVTNFSWFAQFPINGTSQATPHVSGVAALLLAADVPSASIEEVLTRSATDLGAAGYDLEYGWGLLNAAAAFGYPTIKSVSPNSASNNSKTNITITGTNFTSGATAKIGSTDLANISVSNATTITAAIPAHLGAGTYDIKITSGGKTATLIDGFTTTNPAPNAPSNFRAAAQDKKVKLAWSKPTVWDFAGVKILRKSNGYPANKNDGKKVYQGTDATKTDKNLKNGKKYYYASFAYDSGGVFSESAKIAVAPNQPQLLKISNSAKYDQKFKNGANVAVGDLDGDGNQELILASKTGRPFVKIFNHSGKPKFKKTGFSPYNACDGELHPAAGDVDGDGKDEIILGGGGNCPKRVKITDKNGKEKTSFKSPSSGEVRPAAGDLDGDGRDEIILGTGSGFVPKIYIYDFRKKIKKATESFFAFPKSMKAGLLVFAEDLNFDGQDEIIATPQNSLAYLKIFNKNGKKAFKNFGFYPFGKEYKNGLNMALGDINADGYVEILIAKEEENSAMIYRFKGKPASAKKIGTQKIDAGNPFVVIRGK